MARTSVDEILDRLRPPPGLTAPELYGLVDAAQDERLASAICSGLNYRCLFSGNICPDLAAAAPYLVRFSRSSPLLRWILEEGWGRNFGIFAWSRTSFELLVRHFREILRVEDEHGRALFFRYYDPRVFRTFMPLCSAPQREAMFGPVDRFFVEGPNGRVVAYDRVSVAA